MTNKSLLASLHFLGISHHTQKMEIRSKYSLSESQIAELQSRFREIPTLEGCVITSTCNRTEFMFEGGSENEVLEVLADFYDVSIAEVTQHFRYLDGWQVVRHLFCLTSGLDSMVLGDIQITSQLKEAVRLSREAGVHTPLLSKLCQSAFKAGKRVRAETSISNGASSVAYAAVMMARDYLGALHDCSALVVGTGNMGRDVVYNLRSKGLTDLTIMNRTEHTGRSYAALVSGEFMPISRLPEEIADHDIIITCTSAGKILIDKSMGGDGRKKQLFLDLSLPANIDHNVGELDNTARVDIDAIQVHVDRYMVERRNETPKAEAIISEEMLAFQYKQIMDIASPAMVRLREEYEHIRQAELARIADDMHPDMLPTLESLTRRLVKKLAVIPIEIFCGHAEESTFAMEEFLNASYNQHN